MTKIKEKANTSEAQNVSDIIEEVDGLAQYVIPFDAEQLRKNTKNQQNICHIWDA